MITCIADTSDKLYWTCLVICRQLHQLNISQGEISVHNHTLREDYLNSMIYCVTQGRSMFPLHTLHAITQTEFL